MLAVVKAVRKWRPYLLGKPFTVRTDHQSLKYLLEQRITTPAQSRWIPKLLGYDYIIEYKRGSENQAADSLSRQGQQPRKWIEWIPWAEFSYNTSTHSSTKMTLFEAVYGMPPPSLLAYVPGTDRVQAVDEYLQDRDAILREIQHNLRLAQERMKGQANQHRREVSFEVSDYIYLKLQPYRQTSVAFQGSLKLSPRFFGPFKVLEKVGNVAYKLDLPAGSQIHNVVHVSRLRKFLGNIRPVSTVPPPVADDSTILPQPKTILARREIQKGKYRPRTEILVKWRGTTAEDATWENAWRFSKSYPNFVLEDKAGLSGGDCYVSHSACPRHVAPAAS
ncbi:hypothetical protein F0562_007935 [Nyssa sinensis]|uniref:Chromo domain-containing protein n=1 Tax=Nyssa sinensis TaxID=561372 RepID=A0A5J5A4D3_9ASTE|nr:hypothetical protein F0562_007935 [Nyssa sinensis]